MRRSRRGAAPVLLALAAALALAGAGGCKPSSLTPLGIEERGPEPFSSSDVNGLWQGIGATGEKVRFLVGSGTLADFLIENVGGCSRFFATAETFLIDGTTFAADFELSSGGHVFFSGSFTSGSTCTGNYSYTAVSVIPGCPRDGAGSFVATKTR